MSSKVLLPSCFTKIIKLKRMLLQEEVINFNLLKKQENWLLLK